MDNQDLIVCTICHTEEAKQYYNEHPICPNCSARITAYEAKVTARIDRLNGIADKRAAESAATWDRAHEMAQVIPFGQPILIGHHSEKRDRAYRERIWQKMSSGAKLYGESQEYRRRADSAANSQAISSDDPTAVIQLKEKLAGLIAVQDTMKAENKAIRDLRLPKVPTLRRGDDYKTWEDLKDHITKGYRDHAEKLAQAIGRSTAYAAKLLTPDYMGRIGHPPYLLSNNSANMRRIEERIKQLETRLWIVDDSQREEKHGDVTLQRDPDDNRLRLIFPAKPDRAIILALKANGFHWSKYNGAWQRQLNESAEAAAKRVLILIEAAELQ